MTRRKAIVTGSASGIGAATVLALAGQGYDTVGIDCNLPGSVETAAQAIAVGGQHHALHCDVSDEAALVAVMAQAVALLGGLDALATCAGIAEKTPFMQLTATEFKATHDVNVIGTFVAVREAARHMQMGERDGGRICTVASVAGLRGGGLMGTAAYAASKGAVLALSKNAARALAGMGISVNCIAPGATLTPMIADAWENDALRKQVESLAAQNRTAAPHEIAANIAYLLSPQASYVTGATLVADGGLTMY
jgi:NAD(P)-dependent dehydrogenase (short-subunit alcohol dehydrogenase family)